MLPDRILKTPMATTSLNALNAAHGIAQQLRVVEGPGGLPMIDVDNAHATARISLYGGQALAYRPRGAAADLLFVSEQAFYQPGKAIRGGVPVCWPWFGPDPQGQGRPAHGLARTRLWSLRETAALPGGETRVVLGLNDTAETRALWPHAFDLSLTIAVGPTLRLALTTRNTGSTPCEITQALHSYFAVGDIAQTRVSGLDGCVYIDKAAGAGGAVRTQNGDVTVNAEVDRVYTGVPAQLTLVDGARSGRVRITAEGSRTTVVWNPWAAIAAGMADLKDDEHQRFVCVETANAADDVITLAPGAAHTLVAHMAVAPY
jgi:glucose-6-phosphate 1-epimerase